MVLLDLQVTLDPKETKEILEQMVRMVLLDLQVTLDPKETKEILEQTV
jgi:hypothetical protein